jgi:hypothetical protein
MSEKALQTVANVLDETGIAADNILADQIRALSSDNSAMRKAGCNLAAAALYTIGEFDGLHRLSLAVAEWSKAIGNEGGRGA